MIPSYFSILKKVGRNNVRNVVKQGQLSKNFGPKRVEMKTDTEA